MLLKDKINEKTKQKHRDRENELMVPDGKGVRRMDEEMKGLRSTTFLL